MDIIFIDELRITTLIGIYPREQAVPQALEISLQIGTSTVHAGSSDNIRDTIDYAAVVERLRADLERHHFHLLAYMKRLFHLVFHTFHYQVPDLDKKKGK